MQQESTGKTPKRLPIPFSRYPKNQQEIIVKEDYILTTVLACTTISRKGLQKSCEMAYLWNLPR
jgi:hypothetical protein